MSTFTATTANSVKSEQPKPYLEPVTVYGLNLALRTPLFFTEDPQKVCSIVGRMLVIHSLQSNTYACIPLDGITGRITHVCFSHTRRLVALAATSEGLPKIHLYSLRHKSRVAQINVPEGQGLTGTVTSISFSLGDRFILMQMTPPEWPIIVWAIPAFINTNISMYGEVTPFKTVYTIPKPYALFKSQREIQLTQFSPIHLEVIHGITGQNVHFMVLQEGVIKTVNVFSLKRMVGAFMFPISMQSQSKDFTLLPVRQTGEVLILRKDHMCCFIPSELIFGQKILKTTFAGTFAQQYTGITQYMLRNHVEILSADPNVREEITCIRVLADDIFVIGSSFGRIVIYQILNFEPPIPSTTGTDLPTAISVVGTVGVASIANMTGTAGTPRGARPQEFAIVMPCKAAGGMSIRLPTFRILRSILLPCSFKAVMSIDVCPKTKKVLIYTDGGYVFVSNCLDRDSLLQILAYQQKIFADEMKNEQLDIAPNESTKLSTAVTQTNTFKLSTVESLAKSIGAVMADQKGSSTILSYKSEMQNVVNNEILASAYETIRKIKYLIKTPKALSQVCSIISLINPVKALTGTVANVKVQNNTTQLDLHLYQTPQSWPLAIINTSTLCPFSSYYQVPTTIIASLARQGISLNGVKIDPSLHCSGHEFGQQLHIKNVPITAISVSDETGYVAVGNDCGEVIILSVLTGNPVAAWTWALPEIYSENTKFDVIPDTSGERMLVPDSNDGIQSVLDAKFVVHKPGALSTVAETGVGDIQDNGDERVTATYTIRQDITSSYDFISQTVESMREKPQFTITSLKLHPSGRHLLVTARNKRSLGFVSMQEKPSRSTKVNRGYCVCILHIADSYMECISVIDCDSPCLAIEFDKTGNYAYLLSCKSVYVFSFLEIRLIKRVNLSQRFTFMPRANDFPSYSAADMQKYKQALRHINKEAKPTCMAISATLLIAVAFADGDICLFNSLDGGLLNRYLTGGFFLSADPVSESTQRPSDASAPQHTSSSPGVVTESALSREFDALVGIDTSPIFEKKSSGTNPILRKKASLMLATYAIRLAFIEQNSFSPQGRMRLTGTQNDKVPYTPLLAILADGTATELDFLQQMWMVGRLSHSLDEAKADTMLTSLAKCVGRLVPTSITCDLNGETDRTSGSSNPSRGSPENPADSPLLSEYNTNRFTVISTFPLTSTSQANTAHQANNIISNLSGASMSVGESAAMRGTKGILGQTVATVGDSATYGGRRGAFALPITFVCQLPGSQYHVAVSEDHYVAFERYKSAYINSLTLSHGFEAYLSWVKLTPQIITEAMNAAATRTTTGRFLNDEGIFHSLMMNTQFLNNTNTLLVSGSFTGAVILHPYPIVDQITNEYHPTHFSKKLHSAPVSHTAIVRGSYVVSCSVDGMILISRIRYPNMPFVTKPFPRSSLGLNHIVRSRNHQEILDLLFYELLTRTLLVKQASLNCIHNITISSEIQLKQLMERYFDVKKDSVKALSGAYVRHDRMLKKRTEIMADRDIKQNVMLRELIQSFEEQLNTLQYDKNRLIERLMHNEERHGNELKELREKMEHAVKEEKLLTKRTTEDLQRQLDSLYEDEKMLRSQTEQNVDEANRNLEAEVAALKAKFSRTVLAEASGVTELRNSHKELEKEFASIMQDTVNKKNALMRVRTESNQTLQALMTAKDTLAHLRSDIVDRETLIAEKARIYQNIQKEKVDLEKVTIILKNRSGELKECIAPRDNLLADLSTQASDMGTELAKDQQKKYESTLKISDLKLRRQGLSKELVTKQEKVAAIEDSARILLDDVRYIFQNIVSQEHKGVDLEKICNGTKIDQALLSEAIELNKSLTQRGRYSGDSYNNGRSLSTSETSSPLRKVHLSTAYTMANSIINSDGPYFAHGFQLSPQRRSVSSIGPKSSIGAARPSGRNSVLETRHLETPSGTQEVPSGRNLISAARTSASSAASVPSVSFSSRSSENIAMTAIEQAIAKNSSNIKDTHGVSVKYAQLLGREREFHSKCIKGINSSIKSLYLKHCCENSKKAKAPLNTDIDLKDDPLTQISTLLSTQKTIMSDEMLTRQRMYLERSVATLEKSLERRKTQLSQAIEKARMHSSELLALSNMMRRENKRLQQQLRAAKLELIKKRPSSSLCQSKNVGFNTTISKAVIQIENEIKRKSEQYDQFDSDLTEETLEIFDKTYKKPIEGITVVALGGSTNIEDLKVESTELDEYLNANFPISRSPSPQAQTPPQFLMSAKATVLPVLPNLPSSTRETSDSVGAMPSSQQSSSRRGSRAGTFGMGDLTEHSEISGVGSAHSHDGTHVSLPPLAKYRQK